MNGFLPSVNGFAFANDFPHEPLGVVDLPFVGELKLGDASKGLCGGMTWAALDLWRAGRPPPADAEPPAAGTPLRHYLVRRQVDSVGVPFGVLKCYHWTHAENADLHFWTAAEEDQAKLLLESGPVPLMLIRTKSWNPQALAHNHQVLLYAVQDKDFLVCDPNRPRQDGVTLASLGVRGWYVNHYRPESPP